MTISKRVFLIVACNILIGVITGVVSYTSVKELGASQIDLLTKSRALQNHLESDMMHDALRGDVLTALLIASSNDPQVGTMKDVEAELAEHADIFKAAIERNEKLDLEPNVRTALKSVLAPLNAYIQGAHGIVKLAAQNYTDAAAALPSFLEKFSTLEDSMGAVSTLMEDSARMEVQEDTAIAKYNEKVSLFLTIFGFLVGCVTVWLLNRSVTRVLTQTLEKLRMTSQQLFSAADQVAVSAQALAQGASEQAASLEETAATVEEISSVSKRNAENAQQANVLSQEVKSSSETGVDQMQLMSKAINAIKSAAEETAQIIKTIDEIAFQTNLLALNAAVEAARAGDAGKGFAVVAEEVRNLAQRSAAAAKDTSEKIHRSKELAENGVKVTKEVERSLGAIRGNSEKALSLVKEIAAASQEQSSGIGQLNGAVTELDKVTQTNAAAAEESAASGEELTGQAQTLDSIIKELSKLIYGNAVTTQKAAKTVTSTPLLKNEARPETKILVASPRNITANHRDDPEQIIPLDAKDIIPLEDGDFKGF
jgi:methyl-accepting chemotaxis protein